MDMDTFMYMRVSKFILMLVYRMAYLHVFDKMEH